MGTVIRGRFPLATPLGDQYPQRPYEGVRFIDPVTPEAIVKAAFTFYDLHVANRRAVDDSLNPEKAEAVIQAGEAVLIATQGLSRAERRYASRMSRQIIAEENVLGHAD